MLYMCLQNDSQWGEMELSAFKRLRLLSLSHKTNNLIECGNPESVKKKKRFPGKNNNQFNMY